MEALRVAFWAAGEAAQGAAAAAVRFSTLAAGARAAQLMEACMSVTGLLLGLLGSKQRGLDGDREV